ncbi:type ISP restriction/modification enzyme [Micromonospora arida]|uniref:type ISP restriction/modification enzyme n=1 Tax=Micromonospora arida TaxID=2203715 RepID=UPI0033A77325
MAGHPLTLDSAVAEFGRTATNKLTDIAVRGEPEDQLRAPLEKLVGDLAVLCNHRRDRLTLVGETSLADLQSRPDYAVTYSYTLVGFIEVKAPGIGADPRKFKRKHDKEQWAKLQALPNLIYTDGLAFSLWRYGEPVGEIVRLAGDLASDGVLTAPRALLPFFEEFLGWNPTPPRTPKQLAETTARLCRLLRSEVEEQLARQDPTLAGLAKDWRHLLFPEATDSQFADSYAQAVTFGLLLARAQGIELERGIDPAAKALASRQSLIGTAMRVLTDQVVKSQTLATSVATLTRVLAVVDWPKISKGQSDAWLYFYEDFLEEYDNSLRKQTGSYYTPIPVVQAMTRFVDEALRGRFEMHDGLANQHVNVVDPAMGTGTFLLEVVRAIGQAVSDDLGEGAAPAAVAAALWRLVGFELQLGPFAVAQLRILAELAELGANPEHINPRLFVTNTLGNPFVEEQSLGTWYEPIAQSRREANRIKRDENVLVVLGNPPYKDKSHGKGGWVESGNRAAGQRAPLADFVPPPEWGVGAHVKHLYNPYVYFWRWATWKVFDNHADSDRGVICLITVAGFLDGPGFQGMRDYLRRRADAIWVIDCSPEGHQPPASTRIFQGVQQPICITLAVRDGSTDAATAAPVYFRGLQPGNRNAKFSELTGISLADDDWVECPTEFRAPFLPAGGSRWLSYPTLEDLLLYSGSGTMLGRTWVVAPDAETLRQRWDALIAAPLEDKSLLMQEHPRDRHINKVLTDALPGYPATRVPIKDEVGPCAEPVWIGYRSFDRQLIIPDKRLINQPNPTLWGVRSDKQTYLTAPHDTVPSSGPAATFTAEVPDLHHYKGSFGGRAFPLWLDPAGTIPNVVPGLLDLLAAHYGKSVAAEDLFAYLAAILAHPGYARTFAEDLTTPGLRVPLTGDREIFAEASAIGRRILWLHSYGQRFTDASDGRPRRSPRLPQDRAPKVLPGAAIPSDSEHMPDTLTYDPNSQQLHVGTGRVGNVTAQMWSYQVSGVNILSKWFSYRRKTRDRPVMGDRRVSALLEIQPDRWHADYTRDLIDLLNVLGLLADLENDQARLLGAIRESTLISVQELTEVGILPVPPEKRKVAKAWQESPSDTPSLW